MGPCVYIGYGAPVFAPLLFTDIAVLGFIALFVHKNQNVWDDKAKKIFTLDWKDLSLLIESEPFRIFSSGHSLCFFRCFVLAAS